ncbi:MAG: YbjN domain-containing protein [bacterium]
MSLSEDYLSSDELHPIDIVETLAEHHAWEFDRVTEDQIAMAVEGQWRTYSLTLAWNDQDETLRLICTFEMQPPENRMSQLYDVLNRCNDMVWTGAFTYWAEQKLMVWRYGLLLSGGQTASPEQIDDMIASAVMAAERFYPAFQLVTWGDNTPAESMKVAIAEAYGRA